MKNKTTTPDTKTVTHAKSRRSGRCPWTVYSEAQIREACNAPLREAYSGRNRGSWENVAACRANWGQA